MAAKHSRLAIASLTTVMIVGLGSDLPKNYALAKPAVSASSPLATVTVPGKTLIVGFTREVTAAYMLARFVAGLENSHPGGRSELQASKRQSLLIGKTETTSVVCARQSAFK